MTIQVASLGVESALVNTNYIYSIPHHPYNGGFRFAGVNLQIILQFSTLNGEKYEKKLLFGHTEYKKEEI